MLYFLKDHFSASRPGFFKAYLEAAGTAGYLPLFAPAKLLVVAQDNSSDEHLCLLS
jgi:hypothetical protein